jgi:hypothetical protein
MMECVFTLDYEIYGNGTGSLRDLVYEPAGQLADLFQRHRARFVVFVETAELARIEECGTDPMIGSVREQVRNLDRAGFEIGLHLHPWWCNARRQGANWVLDYSEYNLCTLPPPRISVIVSDAIHYLRGLVGRPDFTPLSFRAGNWLFQPTEPATTILAQSGIRLDSSVFRGGRQHNHDLDYRKTPKGQYFWQFGSDVTAADPRGTLIEVPIHTEMVPFWRMQAAKRLALGNTFGAAGHSPVGAFNRIRDFLRLNHPLKLDFCRLTAAQMIAMVRRVLETDRKEPGIHRPIVAIGHTKDLSDISTVDTFLGFLSANGIAVSTFRDIYPKLVLGAPRTALTPPPPDVVPGTTVVV